MSGNETMSTAPKDRRILAYGLIGLESETGWGTVKWCPTYEIWVLDPTEASEYSPEECKLWCWRELPEVPEDLA